jgi:hypothetical protein
MLGAVGNGGDEDGVAIIAAVPGLERFGQL